MNHGTSRGYRCGCRCEPCLEAKQTEKARTTANRRARESGAPKPFFATRACHDCPFRLDWWAIRTVAREKVRMDLRPAERREVVRLNAGKMSGTELGELLGVTKRTVERYKTEFGVTA